MFQQDRTVESKQTGARTSGLRNFGAGSLVTLAVAMLAGGDAARAGTITQVTVFDNLVGGNATYGYNAPMLGPGFQSSGGCPVLTNGGVCTVSYAGTTDPGGQLTAVTQSVIMTGSTPAVVDPPIPAYSANANGSANANLASGTVGVAAGGDYLDIRFPESGQGGGSARSFAQANDNLHFNIAGATGSTVTDIIVSYRVTGGMLVPTPAGDSQGELQSILSFGSAGEETDVNSSGNTAYSPVLGMGSGNGWVSQQYTGTPGDFTFTGVYAITGTTADLAIAETLSAQCGLGTSCDYSHTGVVSFGLPTGVTFTSDQGFLTQSQPSSVPEPRSMTFMALGIGGLSLLRFKLGKSRAQART